MKSSNLIERIEINEAELFPPTQNDEPKYESAIPNHMLGGVEPVPKKIEPPKTGSTKKNSKEMKLVDIKDKQQDEAKSIEKVELKKFEPPKVEIRNNSTNKFSEFLKQKDTEKKDSALPAPKISSKPLEKAISDLDKLKQDKKEEMKIEKKQEKPDLAKSDLPSLFPTLDKAALNPLTSNKEQKKEKKSLEKPEEKKEEVPVVKKEKKPETTPWDVFKNQILSHK